MSLILDFVASGQNISGSEILPIDVLDNLEKLEIQLLSEKYKWSDVSLLIVANSKILPDHSVQIDSDQAIVSALTQFCSQRAWFPSFMGASVNSAFFNHGSELRTDISDGLLLVAVVSPVLDRIPVTHEINAKKEERKYAGVHVIEENLKEYNAAIKERYNFSPGQFEVLESSTGILFATGIGHIEAKEFIDFNDSYYIGQELIDRFDEARIAGGCPSNRTSEQFQCLYYSEYINGNPVYRFSYRHGAVFAFLPYSRARFLLLHPYEIADETPLKIEFSTRDQYAPGRYFYVKSVNGEAPVDYFAKLWHCSREELYRMQAEHTPIPADPKTYGFTIGSSKSVHDKFIWPNVGGWLEKVDGEILLRLVRAEDHDSNYFLMAMAPDAIQRNAEHLSKYYDDNIGKESSIISFICESRKYYLNSIDSNIEAETILALIPDSTKKIGLYVNGEYSLGDRRSIGYHNFSQISTMLANRNIDTLPFPIFNTLQNRTDAKVFISHATVDKPLVNEILMYMKEDVRKFIKFWIDEQDMIIGENLKVVIERTVMKESNYLVLFLSHASLDSTWVREEVSHAIRAEKSTGRNVILPVLLDDVWEEMARRWETPVAEYLSAKLYLRCVDHEKDDLELAAQKLARAIETWIKRSSTQVVEASTPPVEVQPLVQLPKAPVLPAEIQPSIQLPEAPALPAEIQPSAQLPETPTLPARSPASIKLIGRLGALVFGILGFLLGLILDVTYAGANHIFDPSDQAHGFIGILLLLAGLAGAITALWGPLFAAILLVISAVGFVIIAHGFAIIPSILLLIAAILAFGDHKKTLSENLRKEELSAN